MNWQGINEFVFVVENRSFTVAAKRLGLSTAHVSRQVNKLEQRLNTKLLNRTTRVVVPTDAGEAFYQSCRVALEQLDAAESKLSAFQTTPQGKLNITAPITYGERKIAPLVNSLAIAYPELQIQLHLTNRLVDLLSENFDVAIRLGELEDSSLLASRLANRRWFLAASPAYIKANGAPASIADLSQHACILGTTEQWKFSQAKQTVTIRPKPRIRCNSGIAIIDAALKGMGLIQLPDYYLAPYLKSGELVSVLEQYQISQDGIWALYPQRQQLSPKTQLVIDWLKKALGDKEDIGE